MAKMTIAEAFDFPFRRIGQKPDGEPYYAVGALRMEPLSTGAVEYRVGIPETAFAGPVRPSYAEAVGAGIKEYAQENKIVGLRVTLTAIEANEIGSSDHCFHAVASSVLEDAIKAHGVFANPVTIAEAFDFPFKYVTTEHYAAGTLRLEPAPNHSFEYAIALPDEPPAEALPEWCQPFTEAVEKGVRLAAWDAGLAGVRVTLTRLLWHDGNSSSWSFETAGRRALYAAIKEHGIPLAAKEKAKDSSAVPSTPNRIGHTKETLNFVLVLFMCLLLNGAVLAEQWHTRLQYGYYYPTLSFFVAAFGFGCIPLLMAGIFFPKQMAARPVSRSPEELKARTQATQWKWIAFGAVCALVGFANIILLDR